MYPLNGSCPSESLLSVRSIDSLFHFGPRKIQLRVEKNAQNTVFTYPQMENPGNHRRCDVTCVSRTRSDQNHGVPPLLAVSDDAVSQRWSRSTGHHCNRVIIYILAGYSLGSIGPNQNNDR